jgi:minor extracellular serine protease Vpr
LSRKSKTAPKGRFARGIRGRWFARRYRRAKARARYPKRGNSVVPKIRRAPGGELGSVIGRGREGRYLLKKLLLCALFALTAIGVVGASASAGDFTEARVSQTQNEYLIVTFKDPPSARYTGGIPGLERTKPDRGKQLNTRARNVQAYARHLGSAHRAYRDYLAANAANAQVVREYFHVLNGFALKLNGTRPETAAAGPGVGRAAFSWLYRPTMTVSNELIDADLLWPSAGGRANAGSGIKIGIIDTGIREDHPAFGCKADIEHDVFASGVSGNTSNTIVFNHGTHVAGTAAGCVLDLSGP